MAVKILLVEDESIEAMDIKNSLEYQRIISILSLISKKKNVNLSCTGSCVSIVHTIKPNYDVEYIRNDSK